MTAKEELGRKRVKSPRMQSKKKDKNTVLGELKKKPRASSEGLISRVTGNCERENQGRKLSTK